MPDTEVALENKKLKPRWRIWRVCLLLLLVIIGGVIFLLYQPKLVAPFIVDAAARHNVNLRINSLSAQFVTKTHYQLKTKIKVDSQQGINIEQGEFSVDVNWWDLIQGKPFVTSFSGQALMLQVDKKKLQHKLAAAKKSSPISASNKINRWVTRAIPQSWQVKQSSVQVDGHTIGFNLKGQGKSEVNLDGITSDNEHFNLSYSQPSGMIKINTKALNLAAFTGYDATVSHLNAVLNITTPTKSYLRTNLDYQGINTKINAQAVEMGLDIALAHGDERVVLLLKRRDDGVSINLDKANLSILNNIKPLIPRSLKFEHISGVASGEIIYRQNKGLQDTQLAIDKLSFKSPQLIIENTAVAVENKTGKWHYDIILDKSNVLLPTLFKQDENKFIGRVKGIANPATKTITFEKIELANKEIEAIEARGHISYNHPVYVDISGEGRNADVSKVGRYLPYSITPESLQTWLENALVSGTKNQSSFKLKGNIEQFLADDDFIFEIETQAQDLTFHYLEDNPDIFVKDATLTIKGKTLTVTSNEANIENLAIANTKVTIENLFYPVVTIATNIKKQSIKVAKKIAKNSIAKMYVTEIDKFLAIDGNIDIGLSLSLDIEKEHYPFDLKITSDKATGYLKSHPDLILKKAQINTMINQNGLITTKVKAMLLDNPIDINLSSEEKVPNDIKVKIKTTQSILELFSKAKIIDKKAIKPLSKVISGHSDYRIEFTVSNTGDITEVIINSNLIGSKLNLFSVLQKKASEVLPLSLKYTPKTKMLSLDLENKLNAEMGFDNKGNLQGILIDNSDEQEIYTAGKAIVNLRAKSFDYKQLSQLQTALSTSDNKEATSLKLSPELKLNIKKFITPNLTVDNVIVMGKASAYHLRSDLLTADLSLIKNKVEGSIEKINIDRILTLFTEQQTKKAKQDSKKSATNDFSQYALAKTLPEIQLEIASILYKGKSIGSATISTSIKKGLYSIDEILLSGDYYLAQFTGHELQEAQGVTTKLYIDFKSEKLKRVLHQFSLNELVDANLFDASIDLSWPGRAHELNLRHSYGRAQVDLENLAFLDIRPGVGSVLGLMDINSFIRRIKLDFSSLSSSKLTFDTVNGRWNIGGGRAMTKKFDALGALISLDLVGGFDLQRREFDNMVVTVIPKASNVLPVIGVAAGGVVGGVAALVVQQTIGDSINKAIGVLYDISGTWTSPKITSRSEANAKKRKGERANQSFGDK